MTAKLKSRSVICWWLSGSPQGIVVENPREITAFVSVRNGLVIEIRSDGQITKIEDWYWETDSGEHAKAIWHEYEKAPKRWAHKYLLVWWRRQSPSDDAGFPHAMVVYKSHDAHELAEKYKASLFEIFHKNGKIGEALDYKYVNDGKIGGPNKPEKYNWKAWTNFMPYPRGGPWGSMVPAGPRRMS